MTNYLRNCLSLCYNKLMSFRISVTTFRLAFCLLSLYIFASVIKLLSYPEYQINCKCCPCLSSSTMQPMSQNPWKIKIKNILNQTQARIRFDLRKYNFKRSGARRLEDLLVEYRRQPVRNIIVSTWRSGSTYFGEIVNAVPASFYHYEPLLVYGMKQIRGPPNAAKVVDSLRNMLKCNFSGAKHYFTHGKKHWEQFSHNTMLWEHCKDDKNLCYDVQFTDSFCKLFPFQSMKVLRVRLELIGELLEDIELNLRVVLLVRDPRGVMHSRQHWSWCRPAPDCWDPKLVCGDMVNNFYAARRLLQRYPTRIMILRYEDLTLKPNVIARRVLRFLRLDYTTSVKEFLHAHGTIEIPGISSTFRVSQEMPFKWIKALDFTNVDKIQKVCMKAMDLFGYGLAHNASHMLSKDFRPLLWLKWKQKSLSIPENYNLDKT